MNLPLLTFALFAGLSCVIAEAGETKFFPENTGIWPRIEVPSRFILDPASFQGESKWWAKLEDPESDLEVEVTAFGYISELDLLLTVPGVTWENYEDKLRASEYNIEKIIATEAGCKTAGSYFRKHILPRNSEELRTEGYERYIHRKPDGSSIFCLPRPIARRMAGSINCCSSISLKGAVCITRASSTPSWQAPSRSVPGLLKTFPPAEGAHSTPTPLRRYTAKDPSQCSPS